MTVMWYQHPFALKVDTMYKLTEINL